MARILLVDDEVSIRKPLRILLESRGHEVSEAKDGTIAMDMVRENTYDLLVTDVMMPNKGGMESIVEIYQSNKTLPIIVMSGKIPTSAPPIQNLAQQFGVREILQKPFKKSTFLVAVDKALTTE